MWMLQHATTLHLAPQTQDQFTVPISLAFNADQGIISERTVLTTIALTATGQPLVTINQSVQNESVGYAKKRDILLPTALSIMTGMIMTSSRIRNMLGTELVTQGNEGGSIMGFLSFLSSPYRLTISPSMYGYNVTQSPMWLILICLIFDSLWLRCYSTSRQLSLGAVPHVPTHSFMGTLALVLLVQHGLCMDLYSI